MVAARRRLRLLAVQGRLEFVQELRFVLHIRQEHTAFGPLLPGVDQNSRRAQVGRLDVGERLADKLAEALGRG